MIREMGGRVTERRDTPQCQLAYSTPAVLRRLIGPVTRNPESWLARFGIFLAEALLEINKYERTV
jgi:hypothetical protein